MVSSRGARGNGLVDPIALEDGLAAEDTHAVLWENGKIHDIGTLGGSFSIAISINNRGQVVGFAQNAVEDPFSLLYSTVGITNGTQSRGFLYEKGHMRDLGTLGGPDAQAFCLNEHGEAAGISYVNSTPNPVTGLPTAEPFLWTKERGMIDLGSFGGVWGGACPLNNRGQVLGTSSLAADPAACFNAGEIPPQTCHPFLWDNGKLSDLTTETNGGDLLTANALNDAGEIVGSAAFPGRPFSDAYVWRKGVARYLGAVQDDCFSEAAAINSRDQIVGLSASCTSNVLRTFLWENGSIVDLNALSSPNSLQLIDADSINDRGEIAGVGVPPGCSDFSDAVCGHAYLLIPVCADGTEGCADAPLHPAVVAKSRAASDAAPKKMTAEELGLLKARIAQMRARFAARNRRFGFSPRR